MTRAEFRARVEPHPGVPRASDRARQIVVIAAVLYAIVAGVLAVTAPGGVQGLQGGAFDHDGSFLGVNRAAYGIWIAVAVGLVAYAVWQALPRQAAAARQRSVGWWIAGGAAVEGLWATVARNAPLWSTVVAVFLLLAVSIVAYVRVVRTAEPQSAWVELLLVDGVVGVQLGWVVFGAAGNLAALLTALNPAFWSARAPLWGLILVIVVTVGVLAASAFSHWRIMPPLAAAWALLWVAVGRLDGEPYSVAVGVTAAICAGILALVPALIRVLIALSPNVD